MTAFLKRVDGRLIIGCAIVANLLLFVRVAVVHSPFYSYEGPSGADRVYYYAYTRSLVIDRDLVLEDEFRARPPTSGAIFEGGRQLNKYPIGAPLLSLPAFALVHTVASLLHEAGVPLSNSGYSPPYALAYAFSQMGCAFLGIWLLFETIARCVPRREAAIAVIVTWFGSNALHYTAVDLMMSHAAALFSIAWCGYEAMTLGESFSRPAKWCRLGMSAALVCLVRYQNAVFLLVPAAAVLDGLRSGTQTGTARQRLRNLACAVAGALVVCGPQLVTWRIVFGSWMVNSYGQEYAFDWQRPHLFDILMAKPSSGLLIWLPLLALGLAGCLAHIVRRRDVVVAAALAAWTLNLYVISSWWAWMAVAQRSTFDILLPVALGVGVVFAEAPARWRPAIAGGLVALVAWSVPFAAMGVPDDLQAQGLFAAWLHCFRALV